jgi:hypothetical protein
MKKINCTVVVFAFILFASGSCVKKIDQTPPIVAPAGNFSQIIAPSNFNWATTTNINFDFKGLAVDDYQLVLKVTDADGAILLQKLQKANEDYKAVIEVPAYYKTLTVSFGSISEDLDCTNGSVAITIN